MVERQLPKLHTRVRFPSLAPLDFLPDGKLAASIADKLDTKDRQCYFNWLLIAKEAEKRNKSA